MSLFAIRPSWYRLCPSQALNEEAGKKNLKVGVGLMCRHCKARQELFDRIQNGEMGDLIALRCYRMHGPVGSACGDL